MRIPIVVGIDPKTARPIVRYEHPFLAGAQRQRDVRIPGSFTTKSGKEMPCNIVVRREVFKDPPKRFGRKEQERARRRLSNAG